MFECVLPRKDNIFSHHRVGHTTYVVHVCMYVRRSNTVIGAPDGGGTACLLCMHGLLPAAACRCLLDLDIYCTVQHIHACRSSRCCCSTSVLELDLDSSATRESSSACEVEKRSV